MNPAADEVRIDVATASPYQVVIGHGVIDDLAAHLRPGVRRVAVLHAPSVGALAHRAIEHLTATGFEVVVIELPDAEAAKTVQTLTHCWDVLGRNGFTRSDCLVSVGGGATTDLVGFVAATWLRGVDVVHCPTTTLAMVDAAVGGKTGINTAVGKNLVGAFHEPRAVLVDLDVLAELPNEEHRAGLAEVVKAGFISDTVILDLIEANPSAALDPRHPLVAELIARAIAVKAMVVGADLRETATSGLSREFLNYGHTFGHAIEQAESYTWRHGHAVSVGMVFVAELAAALGVLDRADADRQVGILRSLGLPVRYHGDAGWDVLLATMRIDKKARGAVLRFVVLDRMARPRVIEDPDDGALEAAFRVVTGP